MIEGNEHIERLVSAIGQLEDRLLRLENSLREHQHSGDDGSSILTKPVIASIPAETNYPGSQVSLSTPVRLGNSGIVTQSLDYAKSTENNTMLFSVGHDKWLSEEFGRISKNTEFYIQDIPQSGTLASFIYAARPPLYHASGVTFTSGTSSFTDNTMTWETNELAGAWVVVRDSSGNVIETRQIVSNGAHTATITGTFATTTSNAEYFIMHPVYHGTAEFPWRRLYTMQGTDGGIRFGVGQTNNTTYRQNGLLWMDSSGLLVWRQPDGAGIIVSLAISFSSTSSTGAGDIKLNGTTSRTNSGWMRVNKPSGGTTWIPCWDVITG